LAQANLAQVSNSAIGARSHQILSHRSATSIMVGISYLIGFVCQAVISASVLHPEATKPCVAGRCQNGWHDLTRGVWTCVDDNITTDGTFLRQFESACAHKDLDVRYQTCTAPCCGCWAAYWPALLDLWGRCGAPASYIHGEGIVGLKAKEDWYCGNGMWGHCVAPKWDAAIEQLTDCSSIQDRNKLKEPFGLYRDRRSEAESCSCIRQAYPALTAILHDCKVPNWRWFLNYSERRFTDNRCGSLESGQESLSAAESKNFVQKIFKAELQVTASFFLVALAGFAVMMIVVSLISLIFRDWRQNMRPSNSQASLLANPY